MELVIKFIANEKEEIKQVRNLYTEVFEDDEDFIEYFFRWELDSSHIIGGFIGDELVSVMFLRDKGLCLGDEKLRGCYIYGVATKTKYRGRGYMGLLMEEAKAYFVTNNYDVLYLIPVSEKLYVKYGFATVEKFIQLNYELRAAELDDVKDFNIYKLEAYDYTDIDRVSDFAMDIDRKNNYISIEKDRNYFWSRLRQAEAEKCGIYVFEKTGDIMAVIMTTRDNSGSQRIYQIITDMGQADMYVEGLLKEYADIKSRIIENTVMVYGECGRKFFTTKYSINDQV